MSRQRREGGFDPPDFGTIDFGRAFTGASGEWYERRRLGERKV
jgi:hypothetical protein